MKDQNRKLLIISHIQFGYHTGTYKYCAYLRADFDVTYLCFDFGQAKHKIDGVNVQYVGRKSNILANYLHFIAVACKTILSIKPAYIFMPYFIGTSLIRSRFIFSKYGRRMIVDVRTSLIFPGKAKTRIGNALLKLECRFFKHITVISEGLKTYLSLPKRTFILPLGGERIVKTSKQFNEINFLYVGTFYDRNLQVNVRAFIDFYNGLDAGQRTNIKYFIIGYGPEKDIYEIKQLISASGLGQVILFVGEVRYPALDAYIEKCNIGISYIPLKPYYDMQPPTKTFEYLVNGMLVLGTSTTENKRVIKEEYGICTGDDLLSQTAGFKAVYNKAIHTDGLKILNSSEEYTWDFIIHHIFENYLKTVN